MATKLSRAKVGFLHLGRSDAQGGHQRRTERDLNSKLCLVTVERRLQGFKLLQRFLEMCRGLDVDRALGRPPARLFPIACGLPRKARLGLMTCQDFRLSFGGLGKMLL